MAEKQKDYSPILMTASPIIALVACHKKILSDPAFLDRLFNLSVYSAVTVFALIGIMFVTSLLQDLLEEKDPKERLFVYIVEAIAIAFVLAVF